MNPWCADTYPDARWWPGGRGVHFETWVGEERKWEEGKLGNM